MPGRPTRRSRLCLPWTTKGLSSIDLILVYTKLTNSLCTFATTACGLGMASFPGHASRELGTRLGFELQLLQTSLIPGFPLCPLMKRKGEIPLPQHSLFDFASAVTLLLKVRQEGIYMESVKANVVNPMCKEFKAAAIQYSLVSTQWKALQFCLLFSP